MIYYAFCTVVLLALVIFQSFCGSLLITPREVGGTLFGGMFLDLICLSGWLLGTLALIFLIVMRFTGARIALLSACGVQILVGIISLINYPDDANGNLIFSPAQNEIYGMMALLGLLFLISVYIIKNKYFVPQRAS